MEFILRFNGEFKFYIKSDLNTYFSNLVVP